MGTLSSPESLKSLKRRHISLFHEQLIDMNARYWMLLMGIGEMAGPLIAAILTRVSDFRVASSIYGVSFLGVGVIYWTLVGPNWKTQGQQLPSRHSIGNANPTEEDVLI